MKQQHYWFQQGMQSFLILDRPLRYGQLCCTVDKSLKTDNFIAEPVLGAMEDEYLMRPDVNNSLMMNSHAVDQCLIYSSFVSDYFGSSCGLCNCCHYSSFCHDLNTTLDLVHGHVLVLDNCCLSGYYCIAFYLNFHVDLSIDLLLEPSLRKGKQKTSS